MPRAIHMDSLDQKKKSDIGPVLAVCIASQQTGRHVWYLFLSGSSFSAPHRFGYLPTYVHKVKFEWQGENMKRGRYVCCGGLIEIFGLNIPPQKKTVHVHIFSNKKQSGVGRIIGCIYKEECVVLRKIIQYYS